MLRSRVRIAAACALMLSLAGCGGSDPDTVGTPIDLPESPFESPQPDPEVTAPEELLNPLSEDGSPDGVPNPTTPGNTSTEGLTPDVSVPGTKDCVIVAAGVSSILLAPLSFMGGADPEAVARLHDQIDDLRAMVPETLARDFDHLKDVVESGSGGTGEFDEQSYRAAVDPIEEWLDEHCNKALQ